MAKSLSKHIEFNDFASNNESEIIGFLAKYPDIYREIDKYLPRPIPLFLTCRNAMLLSRYSHYFATAVKPLRNIKKSVFLPLYKTIIMTASQAESCKNLECDLIITKHIEFEYKSYNSRVIGIETIAYKEFIHNADLYPKLKILELEGGTLSSGPSYDKILKVQELHTIDIDGKIKFDILHLQKLSIYRFTPLVLNFVNLVSLTIYRFEIETVIDFSPLVKLEYLQIESYHGKAKFPPNLYHLHLVYISVVNIEFPANLVHFETKHVDLIINELANTNVRVLTCRAENLHLYSRRLPTSLRIINISGKRNIAKGTTFNNPNIIIRKAI